jgi:Ser/Thr protein kinase RdoA (MazF antagonist)
MNTDVPALLHYPSMAVTFTPVAGGFSGARIWRLRRTDGREFCLKAHLPAADAARLELVIHRLMTAARAAGLDFVPHIELSRAGRTVVETGGRVWDLTQWMPGAADFHANPTDARLFAAVEALARLHKVWSRLLSAGPVPCPAVERRRQTLKSWMELVGSGWQPRPKPDDPVGAHAANAWVRLPAVVPRALAALARWRSTPVPVQPCLCDVWHDHVLFTGDAVTGLIDYGAAKIDHVAVDLARLLGSLIPGEAVRMAMAVRAYQAIRPLAEPELVELLDWTGVVVGLTNWLRWLYHDGRAYRDRVAVARRVAELVGRLPVSP